MNCDLLNDIKVIYCEDWNSIMMLQYDVLERPRGNQGTRKKKLYMDCVCAFDIETTRLPDIDQSFMYIWQFCINGDCVVYGRTWDQFFAFIQKMKERVSADIVCYVHNLSYEFTFLKGVYDFAPEDVFALDTRRILKARMCDFLELRCSAIHSNMSLYTYTSKYHAKHVKRVDTYDYEKIRYPWTPLDETEMLYCVYDVQGLVEAVQNEMKHDGDTLYTIPLTSTGYVRRDVKLAMREGVSYNWIQRQLPDYKIYKILREAFRGGNTHANRYYVEKKIRNVTCYDRSSSYPDVQMNQRFPVEPFKELPHCTLYDLRDLTRRGYAYLIRISLENVSLKDRNRGDLYLPISKCRHVHGEIIDNGRILEAEYLEHTCTDIDFQILESIYDYDCIYIMDCYYSHYGYLPMSMRNVIATYYTLKTKLKGDPLSEILYMKSKNKLNSVYGMSAQNPLRTAVVYDEDEKIFKEDNSADPEAELLKQNRRAFFSYTWGVWTTAHARNELQKMINTIRPDQFVYCDTDSVYLVGDADYTAYNAEKIKDSKSTGAYAADSKGQMHYMGVAEYDHFCKEFKTLGAKKYVYTDEEDKLHVTIAGVVKSEAAAELGSIDNFKEGFTFRAAGGLEAVYNDNIIRVLHKEGRELVITDNVCLRPSTYTLGITAEFERLLNGLDALGVDVI